MYVFLFLACVTLKSRLRPGFRVVTLVSPTHVQTLQQLTGLSARGDGTGGKV
jgi:hypothetical protein